MWGCLADKVWNLLRGVRLLLTSMSLPESRWIGSRNVQNISPRRCALSPLCRDGNLFQRARKIGKLSRTFLNHSGLGMLAVTMPTVIQFQANLD